MVDISCPLYVCGLGILWVPWTAVLCLALYYLKGTPLTGCCSPKPPGAYLCIFCWWSFVSWTFAFHMDYLPVQSPAHSPTMGFVLEWPKLAVTDTSGVESHSCGPPCSHDSRQFLVSRHPPPHALAASLLVFSPPPTPWRRCLKPQNLFSTGNLAVNP